MLQIRVKPGIEDRIKGFFPWIYRAEIASYSRKPRKGELVIVRDFGGKFLGYGYINPEVSIAVRLLSFSKEEIITPEMIKERIRKAYDYRKRLYINSNAFRLIHSEGDLLPGLIVDVYGEYVVLEFTTYGMYLFKEHVIQALVDILKPKGIYEKANPTAERVEGVKVKEGVVYGSVPEEVIIWEHDLRYYISIPHGQKTGFFLDQREARKLIRTLVEPGDACIDVFCHTGGFALNMKKMGAERVVAVDISSVALETAKRNEELNGLSGIEWKLANAFDLLKELDRKGEKFDVVVIDPPPFAKNRHAIPNALRGYKELCLRGLRITKPGGYMVIFSCSFHISQHHLLDVLTEALYDVRRQVRVIANTFQDKDHPWMLQMPNTLYLKGVWVEVV
ncbi:MAG TPA: class I SAM-dependent rRNA methyltransferase [Aquificaceae bacterium]|nr:class I SAM-dependent rRNA methyltransferase [Aquificaceae bacterium]